MLGCGFVALIPPLGANKDIKGFNGFQGEKKYLRR